MLAGCRVVDPDHAGRFGYRVSMTADMIEDLDPARAYADPLEHVAAALTGGEAADVETVAAWGRVYLLAEGRPAGRRSDRAQIVAMPKDPGLIPSIGDCLIRSKRVSLGEQHFLERVIGLKLDPAIGRLRAFGDVDYRLRTPATVAHCLALVSAITMNHTK